MEKTAMWTEHTSLTLEQSSKRPVHLIAGGAIAPGLPEVHKLLALLARRIKLTWELTSDRLRNLYLSQLMWDNMWAAAGFLALETPWIAH